MILCFILFHFCFFFNDTATTEIYTLSLHDALPIYRAVFGTFERFIGLLIEHYAGKLPFWLAPVQVVVATITSEADDYAKETAEVFKKAGLRVELDIRNEKINYKVREHSHAKVPVIAVVGAREAEEKKVSLRRLGEKAQLVLDRDEALAALSLDALAPDLRRK